MEYGCLQADRIDLPMMSRVILLESVGSTNQYAMEALANPDPLVRRGWGELSVVSTGDQQAGRGRLNRVWTTPPGTALCTSFVIRPHANPLVQIPVDQYHWFTLLVALAAVDTWSEWGISASIKWPNDVLVGERKVCGILAQLVAEPEGNFSVVAGIGMNLNLAEEDLPVDTATSALVEGGQRVDLSEALESLSLHFERYYRQFARVQGDPEKQFPSDISLLDRIRARMSTLGLSVTVHLPGGRTTEGKAVDINRDGEILVQIYDGGLEAYSVGDVVHLRPDCRQ